jgi:hypothetical protein
MNQQGKPAVSKAVNLHALPYRGGSAYRRSDCSTDRPLLFPEQPPTTCSPNRASVGSCLLAGSTGKPRLRRSFALPRRGFGKECQYQRQAGGVVSCRLSVGLGRAMGDPGEEKGVGSHGGHGGFRQREPGVGSCVPAMAAGKPRRRAEPRPTAPPMTEESRTGASRGANQCDSLLFPSVPSARKR